MVSIFKSGGLESEGWIDRVREKSCQVVVNLE